MVQSGSLIPLLLPGRRKHSRAISMSPHRIGSFRTRKLSLLAGLATQKMTLAFSSVDMSLQLGFLFNIIFPFNFWACGPAWCLGQSHFQRHLQDRALYCKKILLGMKMVRHADSKGKPFELHLMRCVKWSDSLMMAIQTSEKRVRNYAQGPGPKVNAEQDHEDNAWV